MGFDNIISFRRASLTDTELLFKWANDPETRKNSFHSEPISHEEHVRWFQKKLDSPATLILIASLGETPNSSAEGTSSMVTDLATFTHPHATPIDVGLLRLKKEDNRLMISYSVAPDLRGRGLGYLLLRDGLLYEKEKRLLSAVLTHPVFCAEVKPANTASAKIFMKLGFTLTKSTDTALHFVLPLSALT